MMKLKRFKVTDFRSVSDSGWISCDDVTSLVGINESGKSNIITALWKLNPVRGGEIDLLHDLPAKEYSNWRDKSDEISFITAEFELDEPLIIQVVELSGCSPEVVSIVRITRKYNEEYIVEFPGYSHQEKFKDAKNEDVSIDAGSNPADSDEVQQKIVNEMPSFVYYSNYGNLDAQIYLPHAVKWLNGEKVEGLRADTNKVRTLRVLFDYVGLNPQEILELGESPGPRSKMVNGKKQQFLLEKKRLRAQEGRKKSVLLCLIQQEQN